MKLAQLYEECLSEQPPYVPKEFREEKAHTMSEREKEIYADLSQQKLYAEIEVLTVRARMNKEKVDEIDCKVDDYFVAHEENQQVLKNLRENFKAKANFDEDKVNKKWSKKINDERQLIKEDKQARNKATTKPHTAAANTK
eukprot:Seg8114.2 transcript_id=Seg8114.2/GoldUCD/mRNA.D3Y31 product="hypothetical protein" protein_id=Seg8114.2/GoldUCD/D3Y31